MAFGSMENGEDNQPLADINMVPLIDVMLVLLIIFMVTAPLLTHAVKIDLPRASSEPNRALPQNVQVAIDAAQRVYWNGEPVDDDKLLERLRETAGHAVQPELQLRAERTTPYERVAKVMAMAATSGITKIGFVTQPEEIQ